MADLRAWSRTHMIFKVLELVSFFVFVFTTFRVSFFFKKILSQNIWKLSNQPFLKNNVYFSFSARCIDLHRAAASLWFEFRWGRFKRLVSWSLPDRCDHNWRHDFGHGASTHILLLWRIGNLQSLPGNDVQLCRLFAFHHFRWFGALTLPQRYSTSQRRTGQSPRRKFLISLIIKRTPITMIKTSFIYGRALRWIALFYILLALVEIFFLKGMWTAAL